MCFLVSPLQKPLGLEDAALFSIPSYQGLPLLAASE